MGNANTLQSILGAEPLIARDITSKRRLNSSSFASTISSFKKKHTLSSKRQPSQHNKMVNRTSFVCRKRPMNIKESEFDFDAVSGSDISLLDGSSSEEIMWAHKCGLRLDEKHMYVEHHGFSFDAVFNERSSTLEVFQNSFEGICTRLVSEGLSACIMAFGATGSGKTFTMNEISRLCISKLFAAASVSQMTMTCFEVINSKIVDALDASKSEIVLRDDNDSNTTAVHATRMSLASYDDFLAAIRVVHENRVTKITGVHDQSSRTHLIIRLQVSSSSFAATSHQQQFSSSSEDGVLYLCDLAGSEWSADQQLHDAALRGEAREINSSLMVLKQCIRARVLDEQQQAVATTGAAAALPAQASMRAPYRESKLTRILRNCFENKKCHLTIVSTVSPSSADTEHSMNTMFHTSRAAFTGMYGETLGDGISGQQIVVSNVEGVAIATTMSPAAIAAAADLLPAVSADASHVVAQWSSMQVCEWWVTAATSVVEDMKREAAESTAAAAAALLLPPPQMASVSDSVSEKGADTAAVGSGHSAATASRTVTVKLSAKQWVKLRLGLGDSLGLVFDTTPADNKTTSTTSGDSGKNKDDVKTSESLESEAPINFESFPIVQKVLNKGYVTMLKRGDTIRPGFILVGAGGVVRCKTRAEVLSVLRTKLKMFKSNIDEWRKWDEVRPKYMTADMEILRKYVMQGPGAIVNPTTSACAALAGSDADNKNTEPGSVASNASEDINVERNEDNTTIEKTASAIPVISSIESDVPFAETEEASGADMSNVDTVSGTVGAPEELDMKEPSDFILTLEFRKVGTASALLKPAPIPRVFTGESRTGELWGGQELIDKYLDAGPGRFVIACNNDDNMGKRLHAKLAALLGR